MQLARVIGTVVSTVKHPTLQGQKLMMLQPLKPDQSLQGNTFIAIDAAQAGVGDLVLVVSEGGSSRQVLGLGDRAPVRSTIVGIVDAVEVTS